MSFDFNSSIWPSDLHYHLISFLDPRDVNACSQVCKRWKILAHSFPRNIVHWTELFRQLFFMDPQGSTLKEIQQEALTVRELMGRIREHKKNTEKVLDVDATAPKMSVSMNIDDYIIREGNIFYRTSEGNYIFDCRTRSAVTELENFPFRRLSHPTIMYAPSHSSHKQLMTINFPTTTDGPTIQLWDSSTLKSLFRRENLRRVTNLASWMLPQAIEDSIIYPSFVEEKSPERLPSETASEETLKDFVRSTWKLYGQGVGEFLEELPIEIIRQMSCLFPCLEILRIQDEEKPKQPVRLPGVPNSGLFCKMANAMLHLTSYNDGSVIAYDVTNKTTKELVTADAQPRACVITNDFDRFVCVDAKITPNRQQLTPRKVEVYSLLACQPALSTFTVAAVGRKHLIMVGKVLVGFSHNIQKWRVWNTLTGRHKKLDASIQSLPPIHNDDDQSVSFTRYDHRLVATSYHEDLASSKLLMWDVEAKDWWKHPPLVNRTYPKRIIKVCGQYSRILCLAESDLVGRIRGIQFWDLQKAEAISAIPFDKKKFTQAKFDLDVIILIGEKRVVISRFVAPSIIPKSKGFLSILTKRHS